MRANSSLLSASRYKNDRHESRATNKMAEQEYMCIRISVRTPHCSVNRHKFSSERRERRNVQINNGNERQTSTQGDIKEGMLTYKFQSELLIAQGIEINKQITKSAFAKFALKSEKTMRGRHGWRGRFITRSARRVTRRANKTIGSTI